MHVLRRVCTVLLVLEDLGPAVDVSNTYWACFLAPPPLLPSGRPYPTCLRCIALGWSVGGVDWRVTPNPCLRLAKAAQVHLLADVMACQLRGNLVACGELWLVLVRLQFTTHAATWRAAALGSGWCPWTHIAVELVCCLSYAVVLWHRDVPNVMYCLKFGVAPPALAAGQLAAQLWRTVTVSEMQGLHCVARVQ